VNKPAEINRSRTRLRTSGLLLGIVVLIWLPIEESSALGMLVVAVLICTWAGIWLLLKTDSYKEHGIIRHMLIGGGAGFLVAPLAILLMAIKTGIHGHGVPDFTIEQMQAVLSRMPYFIFGGLLVGAGIGLLRATKQDQIQELN
jgi:hypothetical protein